MFSSSCCVGKWHSVMRTSERNEKRSLVADNMMRIIFMAISFSQALVYRCWRCTLHRSGASIRQQVLTIFPDLFTRYHLLLNKKTNMKWRKLSKFMPFITMKSSHKRKLLYDSELPLWLLLFISRHKHWVWKKGHTSLQSHTHPFCW